MDLTAVAAVADGIGVPLGVERVGNGVSDSVLVGRTVCVSVSVGLTSVAVAGEVLVAVEVDGGGRVASAVGVEVVSEASGANPTSEMESAPRIRPMDTKATSSAFPISRTVFILLHFPFVQRVWFRVLRLQSGVEH